MTTQVLTESTFVASSPDWKSVVRTILNRHPAVGLIVGVVRNGKTEFVSHGYADVDWKFSVAEDTVFRVGSITKTMTAIAVMQLVEDGRLDLDAPAADYLDAYRLTLQRDARFRQPTLRQLLTHTAGIPDAQHFTDLLHFTWGPWDGRPPTFSVPFGHRLPTLADYYRHGLQVVVEPGTAFAYSNPGFATVGQIVADVSGMPLERYVREHVFEPLGMSDTDLVRTPRLAARLATGYVFSRSGPRPVADRHWIDEGAGGVYSTARDLSRYAIALLNGGANNHGRVLQQASLATMFESQYETEADLPSLGLAFFRSEIGGRRVVGHDGIMPGFNSHLSVIPEEGLGLIALTNGSNGAMRWLPAEMDRLTRALLRIPDEESRDAPHRPDIWREICGRYVLPPRIGDMRGRLALGPGIEVVIKGGRPVAQVWWPVPVVSRPIPLVPETDMDPFAFSVDLSRMGMGRMRARFRRDATTGRRIIHTDLGGQPVTFVDAQPDGRSRLWTVAAIAAATTAVAVGRGRRHRAATD